MGAKIILVGDIKSYQSKFNLLYNEINKGNISVVGAIFNNFNHAKLDDIPVYKNFDEIKSLKFDYFILLSDNKDIYKKISDVYLFKQNIIPIRVFEIPFFNFPKYERILKNPPSIISRHCWGGLLFHQLGLKFTSPFVNLFLSDVDFNKLSKNFSYYMSQELIFEKEGYDPIRKSNYPIVKLGDITLFFNHYDSFQEAKETWDKRKMRINYENLFFETTTENVDVAIEFDSIPLENKLCFCLEDMNNPNFINCKYLIQDFKKGSLGMFVNGTATGVIPYFDLIDLCANFNFKSRIDFGNVDEYYSQFLKFKKSNFYKLEDKRFAGKDTDVNWLLDDKLEAYNFVDKYGVFHPKIISKMDNIEYLRKLNDSNNLPDNFVLKISNRASCIGVMLLRKLNDDLYFDDFTSKHFTIDEIINEESAIDSTKSITLRDTYYFVEELIDNFVPYFKIPFDYKIFLLKGVPKLILQISRNINHYTITLFDGNFMPLKEGRDWFINHDVAEVGIPIIPPSAFSMLKQSIMMANDVDDKYVRIDWFDDGSKPVFGEFTFATGASYTGMFALSDEIIANLDISLTKEYFTDYQRKGYRINTKSFLDSLDSDISHVSLVFNELIGKASLGNLDSMLELSTYFEKLAVDESDSIKKKLYQHLAICWEEVLLLYDDKHTEKLCRQINASWGFIFLKTSYFYQRIVEAKNALYNIGQKSDWYKVRCAQFMLDFNLDGQDKLELIECVRDLANDGFHYASVVKDKYQL